MHHEPVGALGELSDDGGLGSASPGIVLELRKRTGYEATPVIVEDVEAASRCRGSGEVRIEVPPRFCSPGEHDTDLGGAAYLEGNRRRPRGHNSDTTRVGIAQQVTVGGQS